MTQTVLLANGKTSGGRNQWLRHQKGEYLTQRQRILAKCYECCGGYVDGKVDCGIRSCPLYPLMPYGAARRGARMAAQEAGISSVPPGKGVVEQKKAKKTGKGMGSPSPDSKVPF